MENIFKQSRFSRTLINDGKMGAYYTDTEHCRRIGNLLEFPEEFIALEPSIGDGSAIAATLEKAPVFPKVYGVELNRNTYEEVKKDERFYVIGADFLNGIKVSNKAFSYVFSNPPYGVDADRRERYEKLFAEKIFNYMVPGGILAYVIPYPVFMDERFLKPFFSKFNPLCVFRFDDAEYAKFHQIVVIAQRRRIIGYQRKWFDEFVPKVDSLERVSHNSRLEKGDNSVCCFIPMNGKQESIDNLSLSEVSLTEEELKEGISQMLRNKRISITDEPQVKLQFSSMDDYFKKYGPTLVKNLEETITPLRQLDGEAHDFTLNAMRLYPQQLAQINGDVALLERGKYAILNHGMGTGKTITAPSVAESFFVRKYLRSHPKETYADAYKEPGLIKYRNIIMCPGHLVQKWADEISRQVPYAKVTVLKEFSQLVDIRRNGSKRRGKEYFILSKDFCKLSYQSVPSPTKSREGILKDKECAECGKSYNKPENTCPSCGSHKVILRPRRDTVTGMVCPHCNNVLIPYEMWDATKNLDPGLKSYDFGAQNTRNSCCYYCNEELWQPYVANIGNVKSSKWTRATYYANKAHKGKKTVWVHKDFMDESNIHMGETPISVMDRKGSRRYAPAEFIKRYLKGYFDIAIFDEIQDLKGGFTGQGHAMHALIKASKKQMALTGTIAGGMANHLFYTLFRLDPKRMVDRGFKYTDELAFSKAYGKVETSYEYSGMLLLSFCVLLHALKTIQIFHTVMYLRGRSMMQNTGPLKTIGSFLAQKGKDQRKYFTFHRVHQIIRRI